MYGLPRTRPRRNAASRTPSARIATSPSLDGHRPHERVSEAVERERVRTLHQDDVAWTLKTLQQDECLRPVGDGVCLPESRALRGVDRGPRQGAHTDEHIGAPRRLAPDVL